MSEDIILRQATAADLDLIVGTWQHSYGAAFWGDKKVRMGDFKRGHKKVIAKCVDQWPVICAVAAAAPHVILGWACGGAGLLHYVYVKDRFRGDGICRRLTQELGCDSGPVTVTHFTSPMERWRKVRPVRFNPYLVVA